MTSQEKQPPLDKRNQGTLRPSSTDGELLPYVDEHDRYLGLLPRREIHLRGLRHRAIQVAVFDASSQLWLQLRSRSKDTFGGYWDLSCTGHVDPGENYTQAAVRELREELGLDAKPKLAIKFPASERRGWEFHALYTLEAEGPFDWNRDEIETMQAFTLESILENLHKQMMDASSQANTLPMTPTLVSALPTLLELRGKPCPAWLKNDSPAPPQLG